MICRRGDDHRAGAILRAEDALDEFLHLAAALADQTDDDHIRAGVARHHAEKHALAHAAAGEESHALSSPDGQEGVDGANTDIEWLADRMPRQRVDGPSRQAYGGAAREWAETIERLRAAIDDASEELGTHTDGSGALAGYHARVGPETMRVARRHEVQPIPGKPDDFSCRPRSVTGNDIAVVTDRCLAAGCLQRQSDHAGEGSFDRRGLRLLHRADSAL